jgi:hypothetical protein
MGTAIRILFASGLASVLAACSANAVAPAHGAASGTRTNVRPQSIVADGGGQITVTGPIANFIAGGFTMNEGQGGGFVHVYTAGASFAGPSPFVGENVAVSGSGVPGGNITAANVAQQVVPPAGILALTGPVSNAGASRFTINAPGYGYTYVYLNAQTHVVGGAPSNGAFAQAVGTGTSSETASYVSNWAVQPPSVSAAGKVVALTANGFTLNVDANHAAVQIVDASSTVFSKWPVVVAGSASVTGNGSLDQGVVAKTVSAPSPTPSPPPSPTPTPAVKPIVLSQGAVIGKDNQFAPNDGDTPSGGTGQVVDGIPCAPSMSENTYHVHAYVGILVNGTQIAVPDQIGLNVPGPIQNGFTATAQCYYEIHTHDASGMIHIESPSTAALGSSIYTLGTMLDVWGMPVGPNGIGPFPGTVRAFVDHVPLKGPTANSYTEYTGDPNAIPLYSHEAIWLEIGPTYVLPPNIPAVEYYTEY